MAWLRAQNLTLTAGETVLVHEATFRLGPGDRIAVVGPNGMGKTTLFRTLAGTLPATGGRLESSADLRPAVLDQLSPLPSGTVYDVAYHSHQTLSGLSREMQRLEQQMADPTAVDLDALLEEYAAVQQEFLDQHGYDWEARVRQGLIGAGIPQARFADDVRHLSGGERHRLALVMVLLSGANCWILDEPTNHLDVEAIEWLESTLTGFDGLVLMSSHDRRFLDRAATRVMTWEDGYFWMGSGGYHHYLSLREERLKNQQRTWQRYQEERTRLLSFVERYRSGSRARQAKSRMLALARLSPQTPAPLPARSARLTHAGQAVKGLTALIVSDLVLQQGSRRWSPLSFKLPAKARLCVAGPNGSGKTTLLNTLIAGTDGVDWHCGATLSYYNQEAAGLLPEDATGLSLANQEGLDREFAYHLGARFGLTPAILDRPLKSWSGGERSRLALLFALMAQATALMLDEPTNHLDIAMRRELEGLLQSYPGAVIMVTHDRELMDSVGTHLLWWDGGRFRFHHGRYSELVAR